MTMDAIQFAYLATFPVEALHDFTRVLPGDIEKCQRAGEHVAAGKLADALDAVQRLLTAHASQNADA